MEKNYENMGIYDLRNYARTMGVNSPTTLKRAELIEKINEIINGKIPDAKKSNKGRPPRHKANLEFILDFVLPDNLFENQKETRYKTIFSDTDKSYFKDILSESSSLSCENILFKGFFYPQNDDYGFACLKGYVTKYYKENAIVLNDLSNRYQLKEGDYLVGVAKYVPEKNILLATDINYINDINVKSQVKRLNFEDVMPQYPSNKILLSGNTDFSLINKLFPLAKGARVCINFKNEFNKISYVKHLLSSLSNTNEIRTILFSIEDSPEDIGSIIMSCPDVEVCTLSPSQTRQEFCDQFRCYINNCKNRFEFNQDVAVIFYNVNKFIKTYTQHIIVSQNLTENASKILAMNLFKDIFNSSRSFDNGSLTIIFMDEHNEFADYANCYIEFMNNYYIGTDICLDVKNSYLKNEDKILSAKECKTKQNSLNNFDPNRAEELFNIIK